MELTSSQPSSVVEENQSAARRSPPLSVAVDDQTPAEEKIPAGEVEECQSILVRKRKSLKIKRPQSTKRNWRELEVQENERLMEDDVELATFMRLHWSSIRTFIC